VTALTFISYAGPICGIVGFIISPGLTIIYPWLKEKFSERARERTKYFMETDFTKLGYYDIYTKELELASKYRWDWRPKIIRKKKELNQIRINREKEIRNRR
jgi:hypothetical protein